MNSTTKAVLIIGSVLMVCLTALGIAVVVSGDDEPAPVPTVTAPAPEPDVSSTPTSGSDEYLLGVLQETWDAQSYSDQQALCTLYRYDREAAWDAFDSGAEHLLPEDLFYQFFDEKCSTV